MEKTLTKLEYRVVDSSTKAYPVIIVAAGSSSRMNGIDKQLTLLSGEPVLIRTLRAFDCCSVISRIILVVREENRLQIQHLCEEYGIRKQTDFVSGGNNRHESVMNGMGHLEESEDKVLIHDGARPLVSTDVIERVTGALDTQRAVICAMPIVDTVKRVNEEKDVIETVDRTGLYAVQTPQGVSVSDYINACKADAALLTDDAAVMERAGIPVKIVDGSPYNIKITTQKDLTLAELFLKGAIE